MDSKEKELATLIDSIGNKIKKKMAFNSCEICDIPFRDIILINYIGFENKTMTEIANELNTTPGAATIIVDKLIQKKFLKREKNEKIDRRKVFISLNTKGKKIYESHLKYKIKIAQIMLKSFNMKEKNEIIKLMTKINTNLNKDNN